MTRGANGRPFNILLVEDNHGDARLIMEAFKETKGELAYQVNPVEDGEEAMTFIYREGKYAGMPHPDLIILDLNLPRKDGREVLAKIKKDPALRRIPVIVLTTSRAEEDILNAYDHNANCYITKAIELEEFFNITRAIMNFWLRVVVLP